MNSSSLIMGNTVENNLVWDYAGGIYIGESQGVTIDSNIIRQNKVNSDAGVYGNPSAFMATDFNTDGSLVFINNRVVQNGGGGYQSNEAIYISDVTDVTFCNNTIADNNSLVSLGVVRFEAININWSARIWQNIFYNQSNEVELRFLIKNNNTLYNYLGYNAILGGENSVDVILESGGILAPMYVLNNISCSSPSFNNNFKLTESSDCIDEGIDPNTVPSQAEGYIPNYDGFGHSRPVDGDNDNISIYDMGAHEYVPSNPE